MSKLTGFVYAIRNSLGWWYREIADGEAMFVTEPANAKHYDTVAAALAERDALERCTHEGDRLVVRQITPLG